MLLQSRYEYEPKKDLLGKGGFARVYKARDTLLERHVAIKIFNSSGKDQYTVLNEIKKVIQFEHPNLLRYYDVILIEQENSLGETERLEIGVMEYANAGDLKQFAIKHPNSPLLFKFLRQVLTALEYLHKKGIIHRDLKAQNILLIEEHGELTAKLSDFGISKDTNTGTNSASMMVGTIEYMAPEQFSPQKYGIDGKISSNVDLWSFGIMVHELITQTTPFGSRDGNTTAEQIMSSILSTEQPKDFDKLPEPYRTVVKKCLVANAKERIRKASELIQYFEGTQNQGSRSSNNSTANQHQAGDDQSTKVYGKTNDSRSSNNTYGTNTNKSNNTEPQDDKTKVYGKQNRKQTQSQTASKDDKTREYSKDTSLEVSSKWYRSKSTLVIGLILLFSAIGVIWKVEQDKAAFIKAEAERQHQEEIERRQREAAAKVEAEQQAKAENEKTILAQLEQEAKLKQAEEEAKKKKVLQEAKLKLDSDPEQIIKKADLLYSYQARPGKACDLYSKAANLGSSKAQYMLGRCNFYGIDGVNNKMGAVKFRPNIDLAYYWIEKSISSGWLYRNSKESVKALDDVCYMYKNDRLSGNDNQRILNKLKRSIEICKLSESKGGARNVNIKDMEESLIEYKNKLNS